MIGFLDSGIGGLSVLRETVRLLPNEDTLYLADNAHCPYGPQPAEQIQHLCMLHTQWLLSQGCSLIVLACNTATAAAIDLLRSTFPIPFVGMEPAVKPAVLASKNHTVGVLATAGTLKGRLYQHTSRQYASKATIIVREIHGWVEAVERGETATTPQTIALVQREIAPFLEAGVDSLVLGCTHFPFLKSVIQKVAGPNVKLYDPAPAVARRIRQVLREKHLERKIETPPLHLYRTTGSPENLIRLDLPAEQISAKELFFEGSYR